MEFEQLIGTQSVFPFGSIGVQATPLWSIGVQAARYPSVENIGSVENNGSVGSPKPHHCGPLVSKPHHCGPLVSKPLGPVHAMR